MSTPLRWDNVGGPSLTAANLLNIAGTDNTSGGIEDIAKGLTGFNDFLTNKKTSRIALAIQQMQDRDTLNADAAAAIAEGDPRFMNNERLAEVLAKREVSLQEKQRVDLGMEVSELGMDSTRLGMDSTRLNMQATRQDMATQELENERRRFEAANRPEQYEIKTEGQRLGLTQKQGDIDTADITRENLGLRLDAGQRQTEAQTEESIGRNRRAERTSEDFFVQRALKLDQDRQTAEIYARFPGNTKKAQRQRTAEAMRLGIPIKSKNAAEADLDISLGTEARRKEALRQLTRTETVEDKIIENGLDVKKAQSEAVIERETTRLSKQGASDKVMANPAVWKKIEAELQPEVAEDAWFDFSGLDEDAPSERLRGIIDTFAKVPPTAILGFITKHKTFGTWSSAGLAGFENDMARANMQLSGKETPKR